MAWSSAACVFGGVRLISSASTMFEKIGPGTNGRSACPVAWSWSMISVPVMSLGIRSGVNWMRLNFRCNACASVEIGQRFGQPRHADGQAVAAGEDADQHLLDHLVLADNDLVDLADEHLAGLGDAADGFFGTHLGGGCRHESRYSFSRTTV